MKLFVAALALSLTAAAPLPTYGWNLTPAGWGPVQIGMSQAQVDKALKDKLEGYPIDDETNCLEMYSERDGLKGVYFMFIDGRLRRISVSEPSKVQTPRGIGVGASADDVRKAYNVGLEAEDHNYLGAPAEYLTFWLTPKKNIGVRFETDAERKVETIHAGNESIQLIEGCA